MYPLEGELCGLERIPTPIAMQNIMERKFEATVLGLPNAMAFNTVPHVGITPNHKIISIATS